MPEDYYANAQLRTGPSLKGMLLAGLLSFAGGALLVGYLVWNGQIEIGRDVSAPQVAVSPSPSPAASDKPVALIDQQLAALEQRLARLDLQSAAFGGNSARAEGLLVALATRRAIDQGRPLGYLEEQLKTRFGTARPDAVNTIVAAGKAPVTLDMLSAELDALAPALLGQPAHQSGWDQFVETLSNLFVVRRDDGQARPPEQRLEQARLMLRSGRIDEAVREVAQLPGAAAAKGWIVRAQGYAATQAALDQVEEAALNEPERLRDGTGEAVVQPGLAATPAPTPAPTPKP